jgi:acyl-CoA reductase-like NAD-dependent aldehyde dehydrogenase
LPSGIAALDPLSDMRAARSRSTETISAADERLAVPAPSLRGSVHIVHRVTADMVRRLPCYLANRAHAPNHDLVVRDKYTNEIAAEVPLCDAATIDRAIASAVAAAAPMRALPAYERQGVLQHCARRFEERSRELAEWLCAEAGKPIQDSRGEVGRLIDTFRIAAEESTRMLGEVLPMDVTPRARGYSGAWKRVAIGPCSFISPFNFPLNLAAHKIAPAIAAGCPFVLKPASLTPVGALLIGEILAETALPEGAFSILPCPRDGADKFVTDERFKLLSFTGSPEVGWDLKARAGKKRVVLELGGNAAVVVDEDADLEDAVKRIIIGAFYQSGQSCIKAQRILVHESRYAEFRDRLTSATRALKLGDPRREDTFLGPLITEKDAQRLEAWIRSACDRGARVLCGGKRDGALLEATLLEDVPDDEPIACREAFGPVAVLSKFARFEDALRSVNASAFGLQAGVFTRDVYKVQRAWSELEVGAVLIGEVPSWRVDHMPYGGVKDSGLGREGVRFAMQEMTEIRLLVLRTP